MGRAGRGGVGEGRATKAIKCFGFGNRKADGGLLTTERTKTNGGAKDGQGLSREKLNLDASDMRASLHTIKMGTEWNICCKYLCIDEGHIYRT